MKKNKGLLKRFFFPLYFFSTPNRRKKMSFSQLFFLLTFFCLIFLGPNKALETKCNSLNYKSSINWKVNSTHLILPFRCFNMLQSESLLFNNAQIKVVCFILTFAINWVFNKLFFSKLDSIRGVQYSVLDRRTRLDRTGPSHFGPVLGPGLSVIRSLVWSRSGLVDRTGFFFWWLCWHGCA